MCPARCLWYGRCVALLAMIAVILVVNITLVLNSIFQNVIAANGYMGHGTKLKKSVNWESVGGGWVTSIPELNGPGRRL